ncbi:extracellular dioxygenase [Xylariales sp. PMI_506]|nr:extracellular dioxygenase [Xylariales sp. PMI_506]
MLFTKNVILALATLAAAHPGHEEQEHRAALASRAYRTATKRALDNCAAKLEARGVFSRGIERRAAEAARQRIARKIPVANPYRKRSKVKRDTTSILNKDHEGTLDPTEAQADESYVFSSTTCAVLNPEGEVGPYYVPGEYVRSDVSDDEPGVEIILEAQLIDTNTCEPLVGAWFDIWNCNSTGVYSGVQESGNGNSADSSNLDNIALRGIQQSDSDGVVKFTSVFPGHYTGRTNHMHVVVHTNATEQTNGTITMGNVPHIGQFFWDQSLIDQVEELDPYSTNTNAVTTNAEDRVFGEQETENTTSDPVFNYVLLGDDLSDGLFQWIVVGVDSSASYTPTYSFELTSSGGVAVGSSGGGGSAPGGGGGGGPP